MQTVILFIHLLVAMVLIALVLMQRSEGGALGMGGGSNALMTGRGAADVLARGTMALAGAFFVTSMTLSVLANGQTTRKSVLEAAPTQTALPAPAAPAPPPVRAGPLAPAADPAAAVPGEPQPSAATPPAPIVGPRPASAAAPTNAATSPAPVTAASGGAAPVKVAPAPTTESPRAMPAPTPPAPPLIVSMPPSKSVETTTGAKPEPKPRAGPDE